MPLTAQQIKDRMNNKTSEINSSTPGACVECGVPLDGPGVLCGSCEKDLALSQLRRLADLDGRYRSVLEEVEAEEAGIVVVPKP